MVQGAEYQHYQPDAGIINNHTKALLPTEQGVHALLDIDIFCEDEEAYLAQIGGEHHTLSNGTEVVAVSEGLTNNIHAEIKAIYPNENWLDKYPGLSHLAEHLAGTGVEGVSDTFLWPDNGGQNASTTWNQVIYYAEGNIYLPPSPVGLLPFIPDMANMLQDPVGTIEDVDVLFEGERQRVLNEIIYRKYDHDRQVDYAREAFFFSTDNPSTFSPYQLGTSEAVNALTLEDIREQTSKIFMPNNAVFEVFSKGTTDRTSQLVKRLVESLGQIQKADEPNAATPPDFLETMNPDFYPGAIKTHDTDIKNDQVSVVYAWPFSAPAYSKEYYTLSAYTILAEQALKMATRRKGWGYFAKAAFTGEGSTKIFYLQIKVATDLGTGGGRRDPMDIMEDITDGIIADVLPIPDSKIEEISEQNKVVSAQTPLTSMTRLYHASKGIQKYRRIIDPDKTASAIQSIEAKDIASIRDATLGNQAARLASGDFRTSS